MVFTEAINELSHTDRSIQALNLCTAARLQVSGTGDSEGKLQIFQSSCVFINAFARVGYHRKLRMDVLILKLN